MAVMKAKYADGVCFRCGLPIRVGQMIDYRGARYIRHAACQSENEQDVAPFDPERGQYVNAKPHKGFGEVPLTQDHDDLYTRYMKKFHAEKVVR